MNNFLIDIQILDIKKFSQILIIPLCDYTFFFLILFNDEHFVIHLRNYNSKFLKIAQKP